MRRTVALALALLTLSTLTTAAWAKPLHSQKVDQAVRAAEAGTTEAADTKLSYLDGKGSAVFRHPGAEFVKVHFAGVLLLPGDYLTVSNADATEVTRVDKAGWAMSVTGDTAVVKLQHTGADLLNLGSVVAQLGVSIDKVARGYTKAERDHASQVSQEAKRTGKEESVCKSDDKLDAVCYKTTDPVVYRRSKAVARLLINGTELCTAWRVGQTNRMITNHHCIADSNEAKDVEVWFNYQCAQCGGYDVFRPTKVWLDQLIATDAVLDFSLFSVTDFDQVAKFGYLEMDLRRPDKGEQLYIPQHPSGAPAMVAMTSDSDAAGNCAVDQNSYEGYAADTDVSYYCDTEGGSSGSPVLSRSTNKVVALHHFGGCPNSGVRIELVYQKIVSLL